MFYFKKKIFIFFLFLFIITNQSKNDENKLKLNGCEKGEQDQARSEQATNTSLYASDVLHIKKT